VVDADETTLAVVPEAPRMAPVARVQTTDAWLDLIAQRPSAAVMREGRLIIDLGHPGARKYLELATHQPWAIGTEVEDRRAGLVLGRTASLEVPLDGALSPALNPEDEDGHPGLAIAITMRAMAPKQSVTVLWGERPIANLRISDAWERRTLSLPSDLVVPGDNRLRLHFRRTQSLGEHEDVAAAIQMIEVGTRSDIREGAPTISNYRHETVAGDRVRFEIPPGTGLAYYVVPPRRGRLQLDVTGRGGLEVLASTDADHRSGRQPVQLLQEALRETGQKLDIDLSGYADVPTRIEIRVRGSQEGAGATFRAMELVSHRSIPVDRRHRVPRDLYVFALEGVRPDDLFQQHRHGPKLEVMQEFKRESLVFDRAYAVGAAAIPSHAGALTSVVPPGHLTIRGTYIAEARTLLPEALDRAGYFNVVISANSDFSRERGFHQGFADPRILQGTSTGGNDAEDVVNDLLAQIDSRPSPRFVYAVMSDAQAPYDPPTGYVSEVVPPENAPAQHLTHMWVARVRAKRIEPDQEQLDYVRRLYRGELEVIDAALGRFMAVLEERGTLDDSVIVLVGIHGEEFLEHAGAGHGRTLHEESIRVPLAIRAPKLLAPGRVDAPVDLLDLGPTLVDLLGLEFPAGWQGDTLIPVLDDPQPPPRLLVSHLGDGSRAAIVDDYKLILGAGIGLSNQRFYDLGVDPLETLDRSRDGGIGLRIVRTALAWELAEAPDWKRARWGTGACLSPVFALDHGL
jgi:arylsulfatase A-like enzyme